MAIKGNAPIEFIKGEAYNFEIQFPTAQVSIIESVYISCKKLGICEQLTQGTGDNINKFSFLFTPEITSRFEPCLTTYDLTVNSTENALDPQIATGLRFSVKARQNPPTCEV